MKSAVLFLTYRRYSTAAQVFQAIRIAKPERLYFVSNAENPVHSGEHDKIKKVRALLDQVDWHCEVKTLFRSSHLPVKESISSAIDWFFSQESEGIILEDDCLPDPTFFQFCETNLVRYRDDNRVAMITGTNFRDDEWLLETSYTFSRMVIVWGWATWARAWKHYDVTMDEWPTLKKQKLLEGLFENSMDRDYWGEKFDHTYLGRINTWDYQWVMAVWKTGGLSCVPTLNLVSNIGFGSDSEHTKDATQWFANLPRTAMTVPLRHPKVVELDRRLDRYFLDKVFETWKIAKKRSRARVLGAKVLRGLRIAAGFRRRKGKIV